MKGMLVGVYTNGPRLSTFSVVVVGVPEALQIFDTGVKIGIFGGILDHRAVLLEYREKYDDYIGVPLDPVKRQRACFSGDFLFTSDGRWTYGPIKWFDSDVFTGERLT